MAETTELLVQGVLPFDFWKTEKEEAEAEKKKAIDSLPEYAEPKNDNERLFNYQKAYYKGDCRALNSMFELMLTIAMKLISKEIVRNKVFYTYEERRELALDSVCLFISQIKKNNLMIRTSFISYLYLQVRKVLYGRTKARIFENWCLRQKIDVFSLTEAEKRLIKRDFEKWLKSRKEASMR